MSWKIYILDNLGKNFFPARNFCRPVDPSEVKKNYIFELFWHSSQKDADFGEKYKIFFFLQISSNL